MVCRPRKNQHKRKRRKTGSSTAAVVVLFIGGELSEGKKKILYTNNTYNIYLLLPQGYKRVIFSNTSRLIHSLVLRPCYMMSVAANNG